MLRSNNCGIQRLHDVRQQRGVGANVALAAEVHSHFQIHAACHADRIKALHCSYFVIT